MSGEANAGKALTVTVEGTSYARIPIRTRVVMPGDDLDAFILEYAKDAVQPGDLLFQHEPGAGKGNHVGIVVGFTEAGEPLVAHCAAGFDGVVVTGRGDIFRYPRRPRCYGA